MSDNRACVISQNSLCSMKRHIWICIDTWSIYWSAHKLCLRYNFLHFKFFNLQQWNVGSCNSPFMSPLCRLEFQGQSVHPASHVCTSVLDYYFIWKSCSLFIWTKNKTKQDVKICILEGFYHIFVTFLIR